MPAQFAFRKFAISVCRAHGPKATVQLRATPGFPAPTASSSDSTSQFHSADKGHDIWMEKLLQQHQRGRVNRTEIISPFICSLCR